MVPTDPNVMGRGAVFFPVSCSFLCRVLAGREDTQWPSHWEAGPTVPARHLLGVEQCEGPHVAMLGKAGVLASTWGPQPLLQVPRYGLQVQMYVQTQGPPCGL